MTLSPDTPLEPDPNDPTRAVEVRTILGADGVYVSLNDLARYFATPKFDQAGEMTALRFAQLLLELEGFYHATQQKDD